jgi:hypothetical protein
MKTLRIYISSPFRDLGEERQLIADCLVNLEQLPIQTTSASPDPVLKRCLDHVDSCDVMILLVGSSYGTMVPGLDGVRRSVTHHEFLRFQENGKPVLGFNLNYIPGKDPAEGRIDAQTEEQKEGLEALRREMADVKRRTPALGVANQKDLVIKVCASVLHLINEQRAAELAALGCKSGLSLTPPSQRAVPPAPTSQPLPTQAREIYLQVQLQRTAGQFNLIPEVFLPGGKGGWQRCPDADPEPRDAVASDQLVDALHDLGDDAQIRLHSCQAMEAMAQMDQIDAVVIELLLTTEQLAACLSQPEAGHQLAQTAQTLAHLRQLNMPYMIRSLARAENSRLPVRANQLRLHWHHAGAECPSLLACSGWPLASGANGDPAKDIRPFQSGLLSLDGAVAALVALLPCPDDLQHTGELLQAMLRSPLPVLLLWQEDGADPTLRWARATSLLERNLPALPEAALNPDGPRLLHALDLPSGTWCSRAAAVRRQRLVADQQLWVDRAVLLVDCPERWPTRLPPARPPSGGRLQLRRASTP